MNKYELSEYELRALLKGLGYNELIQKIVSEYLDECTCEYNLHYWVSNVLDYRVFCFSQKKN